LAARQQASIFGAIPAQVFCMVQFLSSAAPFFKRLALVEIITTFFARLGHFDAKKI